MASADLNKELEELVECMFCLGRLTNPKVLYCTHSFCKRCLDTMLEFRSDGSAKIECPLRCNVTTDIACDETTNDLKAPIQFTKVIDLLAEKDHAEETEQEKYRCHEYHVCQTTLSLYCWYCPVCSANVCSYCKKYHTHGSKSEFIDFVYLKIEGDGCGKLISWCEKHDTHAQYVCQDGYICLYCKEREHSGCKYDTLEWHAEEVIAWVKKQQKDLPGLTELVQSSKQKMKEEIETLRNKLRSEIKQRKLVAIQGHLAKLAEEEDNIMRGFNSMVSKHLASYPPSKPTDIIENKSDFEVFANKHTIYKKVKNMSKTAIVIPRISVTYTKDSVDDSHPLGVINKYEDKAEVLNEGSTITVLIEETQTSADTLETLAKDLKKTQKDFGINCSSSAMENNRSRSVSESSAEKKRGPVHGNECYFWRTTGCQFSSSKCRYQHIPGHKGIDKQKVEEKYGKKTT